MLEWICLRVSLAPNTSTEANTQRAERGKYHDSSITVSSAAAHASFDVDFHVIRILQQTLISCKCSQRKAVVK